MTNETTAPHSVADADIAIVGMSAHLPGAASLAQYWRNLRDGVSSIHRLTDEELTEAGVPPGLLRHRDYVPYAARLEQFDHFDAEFFGLSLKDAAIMDPQHRQFLECAWEGMFQPLTQLELLSSTPKSTRLPILKSAKVIHPYATISTDVVKSSICIFLAEVFRSVLKEAEENQSPQRMI